MIYQNRDCDRNEGAQRLMRRSAMKHLERWKRSKNRKPLILSGARQVGKTWLLKSFGETYFNNVAYISFDNNQRLPKAFEGSLSPKRLIPILQAESGERIEPDTTLLVLDEIQTVPRALLSLKYFREEAPSIAVVAAGSSLGIALHGATFPVGKVSFLDLHPLSFVEYLDALGAENIIDILDQRNWDALAPFHDQLIELVRFYIFVGGMPEAVSAFLETRDLAAVRSVQKDLLESYRNDFSKHANNATAERLRLIWNSIPSHLANENKRFVFGRIKKSARAREFEDGIQWLEDASLIHRVKRVNNPNVPLSSYQDDSAFKIYLHDIGLLGAMSGLTARTVIDGDQVFKEFKGALGEQFVLQELISSGISASSYFQNETTRTEIDFIVDGLEDTPGAVPVEAKYGTNLRSRSLAAYVKKYQPKKAIRVSAAEHSADGVIENVPFYALSSVISTASDYAIAHLPAIASAREQERPGSSNRVVGAVLDLLEGCPLSRKSIIQLLKERRGIIIDPESLSRILASLQHAGSLNALGIGRASIWKLAPSNRGMQYRLIEGECVETGLFASSRIEMIEIISDNNEQLGELDPEDFWIMNPNDWARFVDDFAHLEDDGDEAFDIVKESGIPRDIKPWQRALSAFGNKGNFYRLIDVETTLEEINEMLSMAFPDYGYRIVKGAPDM